jgi:dihydrofolate reductase
MGALIAIEFMTLDGVVQGFHNPDERDGFAHSGWGVDYQDPRQAEKATEALPATATYLFGRRTYDEMARFWPFQPDENRMAAHLNRSPKYVVTHRADALTWSNARRLDGDLVDGVRQLKRDSDGNVAVLGSGDVVRQLLAADLVDGFHLYVHPVLLGGGHTLFPPTSEPTRLRLDDVDRTATGVVELTYTVVHPT